MTKKKKRSVKKITNNKKKHSKKVKKVKSCIMEKTFGEPMPIESHSSSKDAAKKALDSMFNKPRPVSEYYNLKTGEIFPRVSFKDPLWTRIKRFFSRFWI